MARDSISIGNVPAAEECEQLGPGYDPIKARKECVAFIGQLRRMFGEEPSGARLKIVSNPHDFGSYLDVECVYFDSSEEAMDYAFRCESEMPEYWDAEARAELGLIVPLSQRAFTEL